MDVDALDKLRDELVMALRTSPDLPVLWPSSDRIADALLPVVDRIATERAAAELRAAAAWAREAADNWGGDRTSDARKNVAHGGYVISNHIAARADALDPS